MTKKHFIRAAEIVRDILNSDPGVHEYIVRDHAARMAEGFIQLAQAFNPRFDTQRFLVACGLATKPVKATKGRTA